MSLTKLFRAGIFFWISVCIPFTSFAQNLRLLDSLKDELRHAKPDRQFDLLNSIGFEYRYSYPDSTILYCTKAYELGKKLKVKTALARPLSFIGLAIANQGDYRTALDYQNRSIAIALEQDDTVQLAHGYNNAGRIFFDEGDLMRSYSFFIKSSLLFEKVKDKSGLAYVYRSLATLFKSQGDFKQALQYSQKALELRKELADPRAITSAYMELGLVYEAMDSTSLALSLFETARSISASEYDEITNAELKVGIAEILFIEHKIQEANKMASEVLKVVSEKTNQKIFLRAAMLSAKGKLATEDYPGALLILNQAYASSQRSGNLIFQRNAVFLLTEVYRHQNKPFLEKEYRYLYNILNERIEKDDLNREVERLQFRLQIEETEKENASLKSKQIQDESLIVKQRSQNLILLSAAIFVAVLALATWRNSRKQKYINQKLEDQNTHILKQREEIAKQNEVLSRRNQDLDEINHEKDTLMNIVAHDLKSPLNRIHGLMHIFELEGNFTGNQKEYVRLVKSSTQAGIDLIVDLLDVHAWNQFHENSAPTNFDFASFFNERVHAFEIIAEAKNIDLKAENTVESRIISEPNYLGRIIDNLVSNAIKFSPKGSTVEVRANWKDGFLKISVKDKGPGFSEDDKKFLFQKFRKLSARPTGGESSNGLGLAIVKTLVERLGGSVELKTSEGNGSEFVIGIPAEIAVQMPV